MALLVVFAGLPGSGKSVLSRGVAWTSELDRLSLDGGCQDVLISG